MGEGAIVYNMFTMPAFKFLFMSSHKSGGIKKIRELNQHEKNLFMKLIENSMVYRKKRRGRVSAPPIIATCLTSDRGIENNKQP